MKKFKIMTLSALLLSAVVLGNSTNTFAAEETPKTRNTDAVTNFTANEEKTEPTDPTDPGKPIKPVDPTDPDKPIEPGTDGPLSLDYASALDFGSNKISTKDEVYKAKAQKLEDGRFVPNFAQVSDTRGTLKGWTLGVKQNGQFVSTSGKVLTGAEIKFSNGTLASISESTAPGTVKAAFSLTPDGTGVVDKIVEAADGQGGGTWSYLFGDVAGITEALNDDGSKAGYSVTDSITLSVPGTTDKLAESYSTSLTWTLSSLPANE
ncbi:WxL domain-containing protein [Isobaculum melis]|uniref:WxL domain surface cell wall-binding n=1 Tax=Isobaculum melis TaxID=142588 RepID=A0A1H9SQN1_9LACT|nr:WxL domain-containing protein [Isobaculum melis]SER87241.1 WxL domain surface cell wall-binding [Isobaculum melis]